MRSPRPPQVLGTTAHSVEVDDRGRETLRTEIVAAALLPGREIELDSGTVYVVGPDGSLRRPGRLRLPKKARAKIRRRQRAALTTSEALAAEIRRQSEVIGAADNLLTELAAAARQAEREE